MTFAATAAEVAHYPAIESLLILSACVAVVLYGLWAGTRDPRTPRNTRRDELIVGLGLAAIGLGIALLTAGRVSWRLDGLVEFGRLGNVTVVAVVPIAIAGVGGLAALVGTLLAPLVRRRRGVREPMIRPSRRQRGEG